jgi:catecholate siderophore receptor
LAARFRTLSTLVAALGAPLALPAQTAPPAPADPPPADRAPALPAVRARAAAEPSGKDSVRADTTSIGKGTQELRDVPQSITVVTEKLIDDRNLDTMKDALKNTAGIAFQAAEGGEEDIRLRGFSLQASGDIFIDGMRDPAFYERDSFNWDRLEVLRGSASMLFGRGSTGGAVNQVSKQPWGFTQHEVAFTLGSGGFLRGVADFNLRTGEDTALRINAMANVADHWGVPIDKRGIAPTFRWGIATRDEFKVGAYVLQSENGIHYGLPWLNNGLWPTNPKNYYGLASDTNDTGTEQVFGQHLHRFEGGNGELKTRVRAARYHRDQRASAVRFTCASATGTLTAAQTAAGCTRPFSADAFGPGTLLNRGTNNKRMEMDTVYAQSDYSGRHKWLALEHEVAAGVDAAHESFDNFALTLPAGVTLTKPRTTVGTPDDGASVDESRRVETVNRTFTAKGFGAYVQDLVRVAPAWKLLAGLRFDRLDGDYHAIAAQGAATTGTPPRPNPCFTPANTRFARSDSLWSRRFGVLFQPTPLQSYHLSYGTSFNTAGDTYQYDTGTANVAPEKSRNIELGARLDSAGGDFTTRLALFHSTKYNERNRDAESVDACNYVLSGKRHAAGFEVDLAGRLTPEWEVFGSYAFIPEARVDSSSGAAGTEAVGSRPGLTPRHSGTIWTTYRVTQRWRVGGGLNARGADRPVGLAAGSAVAAPRFVTADLMAEYVLGELSYKLSLTNVTDKHYADFLYRGHYVPGRPRTLQATLAYRFN